MQRIAQKVKERTVFGEKEAIFRLTDMIRCSIDVKNAEELVETFKMIESIPNRAIQVIRIMNNLNSTMRNVKLTFVYGYSIIGEIQLNLGG